MNLDSQDFSPDEAVYVEPENVTIHHPNRPANFRVQFFFSLHDSGELSKESRANAANSTIDESVQKILCIGGDGESSSIGF